MNSRTMIQTVPNSAWRKSSYSSGEGGECVEVAGAVGAMHVRDSKQSAGPMLTVRPEAWTHFVGMAAHDPRP
ncbi:hypothetical protein GCM10027160_09640 [Streptomyces calidiresistens]|uniref:DUF397 domain-containing protein n=1 Tax=Streptomyces calidiresistens TaxID=1485586 RepID=A0A7W3XVV0_9ACTN|nr:DUF397 domain-containing protein [Streptomyces calidiresistens]MBB0229355.1 DUF397 domain-containing protein [Streptomyces calidiresistens]